jgi:hypothetical protein
MAIAANEAHKKAYKCRSGCILRPECLSAAIALLNAIEQAGSTDYDAASNALRTKPWKHRWEKSVLTIEAMPSVWVFPCTRSKMVNT